MARKIFRRTVQKYFVVPLMLPLLGVSMSGAPQRAPKITLVYATAETSTSASVVWNTSTASDSLLQYSTSNPVPANASQVYVPTQVTYHEIPLAGLTPGTLYFYKVTSCAKRGCATATGSFETFPACPDVVPPVSGDWQKVTSPNVSGTTALNNELLGVAAISANDVWTVGWSQDPLGPPYVKRTLIQHFDGNTWRIVQSPNPDNDVQSVLYSVSGKSVNDVWVGWRSLDHGYTPPSFS
jgi:purple acid phosphatase-like protein